MTPQEEIDWAIKILNFEVDSLARGVEIPVSVETNSKLVQACIQARVDEACFENCLVEIERMGHEVLKMSRYGHVVDHIALLLQVVVAGAFERGMRNEET
jgi:hypothetical protein